MSLSTMPNIWGEGKLIAFSGLDGPTNWRHTLVGSATTQPLGIRFHLGPDVLLSFGTNVQLRDAEIVLGDAVRLTAQTSDGPAELEFAFADCWRLVGQVNGALQPQLSEHRNLEAGHLHLEVAPADDGQRFCIALGPDSASQAAQRACEGLELDVSRLVAQRSEFVRQLDCSKLLADADEKTYRKCAELLKVNVRTPEGQIRRRWTTPDVWPHRHLWLWDSAFHSLGWLYLDPQVAVDSLLSVVESQLPDGCIPHMITPEGHSEITQPPILGWAAWKLYQETGDKVLLEACYDSLSRFIEWFFEQRDVNNNGLLEWHKEMSNIQCRCGESGWDNSPRFDRPIIDDHIDLNSFVVCEMHHLARMAEVLGREEASSWRSRAHHLAQLVNQRLWNDEVGLYFDRGPEPGNEWMMLKTAASFLPLLAGIPTAEKVERLVAHLTDPNEFWSQLPVPSVALDAPEFSDDMWRGPTWININYLIWEGLKRYGEQAVADQLRARSMRAIEKWYRAGGIYEYYDPCDEKHPRRLHRKGELGDAIGGQGVICDYGWTAAVYICWAHNR